MFSVRTRPTARRMSWLTVIGAGLADLAPSRRRLADSNAPRSTSAAMRADVHDLVLDPEPVLEAAQLRDAHVERRLAALEPGRDRAAGARLLALRAAARRSCPCRRRCRGRRGCAPCGSPRPGGGRGASCLLLGRRRRRSPRPSTRKRTWRTIPRVAGLSGDFDRAADPVQAERPDVARFRAMWLIVLLIWVTLQLSGHRRPPPARLARR